MSVELVDRLCSDIDDVLVVNVLLVVNELVSVGLLFDDSVWMLV